LGKLTPGRGVHQLTFRFNRRGSNHRGLLFYRLLEQAVQIEPKPLAKILGGSASLTASSNRHH
jgi:hypothetical protein